MRPTRVALTLTALSLALAASPAQAAGKPHLLAYLAPPHTGGVSTLEVYDPASGHTRTLVQTISGTGALWSPDGTRLLFEADDQLWTVRVADGKRLRLSEKSGINANPAWSPDGRHVVYEHSASDIDGPSRTEVVDADGSHRHVVVPYSRNLEGVYSWSPDGRQIAFDSLADGLWIMDAGGAHLRRLTPAPVYGDRDHPDAPQQIDSFPTWSPRGATIAFTRIDGTVDDERSQIWTIKPGATAHQVTSSSIRAYDPAWSHDGRRLAFVGSTVAPTTCVAYGLYVVKATGGKLLGISSQRATNLGSPAWRPGDRQVTFTAEPRSAGCYDLPDTTDVEITDVKAHSPGRVLLTRADVAVWQP